MLRYASYHACTPLPPQLAKAYEELNKRIFEHDTYGAEKGDITLPVKLLWCLFLFWRYLCIILLQAVHDAEEHLEICKLHAEEARKKLQQVKEWQTVCSRVSMYLLAQIRLKLRMKKKEFQERKLSLV